MVVSGKHGKVMLGDAALAEITKWTFRTLTRGASYASSATGGFRRRLPGVKEGRGTIAFKLNLAAPITAQLVEGAVVVLLLHLDATHFYSVPAVIDNVELAVDIDGGDLAGGTAEFVTDGAWTQPT